MTLPAVDGWVIDFRTARDIFSSGSNERISHCVSKCAEGVLFTCFCEQDSFKQVLTLKRTFVQDHNCVLIPDEDVMKRCISISKTPLAKKRLQGNDSAIFLTATAAAYNFGVISNHQSFFYTMVADLCQAHGIPFFTGSSRVDPLLYSLAWWVPLMLCGFAALRALGVIHASNSCLII